jgi:glycine/D-amino acid oxidase-like deaminating enzyme
MEEFVTGKNHFDVIIVGAGSIGVPTAMALGEMGIKTLVVDKNPSPGQGENKKAIGGIRATHSDPAKILTCTVTTSSGSEGDTHSRSTEKSRKRL